MKSWFAKASLFFAFAIASFGQAITTIAGTEWLFNNKVSPAQAPFGRVYGVAIHPSGGIVVADFDNEVVYRIANGIVQPVAGNGLRGYSGDGGQALNARLDSPSSVAVDLNGNVYIAEQQGHRIRKVLPDGTISTFAGTGVPGFSGDNGPAVNAKLNIPTAVAVDSAGNVYVTDGTNLRVRKISTSGTISTIAGNGSGGFTGDGGPATAASMNAPYGIAVDANGTVYIADTFNHRVRAIGSNGVIRTVMGTGDPQGLDGPAASARVGYPMQMAVDAAGALYVTDPANVSIRKLKDGVVTTIAGSGVNGYTGDGGPATKATIGYPQSVAVSPQGEVFIADAANHRIRKVGTDGVMTTFAGSGTFRIAPDGVPATSAYFDDLESIVVDGAKNIYFADPNASRVGKISAAGVMTTLAGNGQFAFSGDNGPAIRAALNNPVAVALDPSGILYIVDSGNLRIRKVSAAGVITTVAGNGAAGSSGDGGPATAASLNYPRGLAFDAQGNMFIADTANHRVRKVTPAGVISTVAGSGQPGFAGDGGQATLAKLLEPDSVAVDGAGNLYIGDISNHRIRKVTNGIITTVAGNGKTDPGPEDGAATSAGLNRPEDVLVDSAGNIYIADQLNDRVRKVTPAGRITTIAGKGTRGFSGDGGPALSAELNLPKSLALDSSGTLYIADGGNFRIRAILPGSVDVTIPSTQITLNGLSGGAPARASVPLRASIPGVPFTVSPIAPNSSWLAVDNSSVSSPADLQLTADPSKLAPGTYDAVLTIASPVASPQTRDVAVRFVVQDGKPPQLDVAQKSINAGFTVGAGPSSVSVSIANTGGGSLTATATAEIASGSGWITVSDSAVATPGNAGALTVSLNPSKLGIGTYTATIRIRSADTGQEFRLPVNLTVTSASPILLLSQSGFTFMAVAGGGNPLTQRVTILNSGSGRMTWSASVKVLSVEQGWLNISAKSGAVERPLLDSSPVDLQIDTTNLAAGEYYGQVTVTAPSDNSPQVASVLLRVLPAGSNPGPEVQPSGLVFTAEQGDAPGSQDVSIAILGNKSLAYASSSLTIDGKKWFIHAPANGILTPNNPGRIVVQPDFKGLDPGVRRGSITLQFEDGSIRTVGILSALAPSGTAAAAKAGYRSAGGCTPQTIHIQTSNAPGASTTVTVGQPTTMEVQIVDNCAQPMTSQTGTTVNLSFSNSDAAVTMINTSGSTWRKDWQPRDASVGSMICTITAFRPLSNGSILANQVNIPLSIVRGGGAPIVAAGAVVNAASFSKAGPVAPGTLITIFGDKLAGDKAQVAQSIPLPIQLADTEVRLGERALPLLYASQGQLNVQVPYDLSVNTQHQLTVRRANALSVPEDITVAATQPGIFSQDQSGTGQGVIVGPTGKIVDSANPAKAGDTVVMYCGGLGAVDPSVPSGAAATGLTRAVNPVTVTIGGKPASLSYAGLTPGIPGLYQINAVVPAGIPAGDAVEVQITAAGQTSPPVTMAIR